MNARGSGDELTRHIQPGDILLFRSYGAISAAIRRFDESDVDHAAIVLDPPETMAEVTASGVRHASVRARVDESEFTYVCRLARDGDARPAIDAVRALERSDPFVVDERLLLLALLGMTSRLPVAEPSLRSLLAMLFQRAAGVVAMLAQEGHRVLLTSDLVYRAYRSSGDPALSLEILLPSEKPSTAPRSTGRVGSAEAVVLDLAYDSGVTVAGAVFPTPTPGVELSELADRAERELTPLIEAFLRVDDSSAPAPPLDEPRSVPAVTDDELFGSAIRFRDQVVGLAVAGDPPSPQAVEHAWGMFRAVASSVTPGDLRYSPSLRTVTSLRPHVRPARGWTPDAAREPAG